MIQSRMFDISKTIVSILGFWITVVLQPALSARATVDQGQSDLATNSKWVRYTRAAERAVELDRLPAAVKFLNAALLESEKPQQSVYRRVSTLKELAVVQNKQGEYSLALENLDKAVRLLKERSEGPILAECLYLQANTLIKQGKKSEALPGVERAADIWQRTLLRKKELTLRLIDLGILFKQLDKYPRAVEMFRQALTVSRELGPKSEKLQRACLATLANGTFQLGEYYAQLQKWDAALPIYLETARLYTEFGGANQENLVAVYGATSQIYQHLGKADLAKEVADKSHAIHSVLSRKTLDERKESGGRVESK